MQPSPHGADVHGLGLGSFFSLLRVVLLAKTNLSPKKLNESSIFLSVNSD